MCKAVFYVLYVFKTETAHAGVASKPVAIKKDVERSE